MARTPDYCKDCYALGYKDAVGDLSPNRDMYAGFSHIIMHARDQCDCGRTYEEIARAAIEKASAPTD